MNFIVIPVFSVIYPFTDKKAYAQDYSVVAMICGPSQRVALLYLGLKWLRPWLRT